ncbi:hypothetical protein HUN58_02185 [Curtobacterium sp. Csp1]|uniref:hypothetical protein n=1 Tax=Curtobacterium sp. Csp1 TaxID=2495429 RepID=UPI00159B593B|nr:hypothetical protein [Curtobacterium sp. Csp1]QKS18868.1 hypothetical protein HUN58_02185 [Curtobacterium sp. Csp1]
MADFWSALIGVVVGAAVTFGAAALQNRWERERAKAQAIATVTEGRRLALASLVNRVAEDLASFRQRIAPVNDSGSDVELMTVAEMMAPIIGVAKDRAQGAVALVAEASVRDTALAVYDSWYDMSTQVSDDIANARPRASHAQLRRAASTEAPEAFFSAVRTYSTALDDAQSNA